MSTSYQWSRRKGTTAQHSTFVGINGELTVDTDKKTVVVHDGVKAGGYPLVKEETLSQFADTVYNKNDVYTKSEVDGIASNKVNLADYQTMNLDRADKYLANQNVVGMVYDGDGKLVKVQYNNPTDVDYEVLDYADGKLTNVAHYVNGVLKGNTKLSYSNGKLISAPFVGV